MAQPTDRGQAEQPESIETDPRILMTREFRALTGFIASLLDDLVGVPPDWRAVDARFETLQRLAMVREQLVRGVGLQSTIAAQLFEEHSNEGRAVGFSSSLA